MDRIHSLLYRHSIGRLTPEERQELNLWAGNNASRRAMLNRLANPDYIADQLNRRHIVRTERPRADMQRYISSIRRKQTLHRLSIAAMVATIIGLAATYIIYPRYVDNDHTQTSALTEVAPISLEVITPGSTKATLITTTGESVTLTASDTADMRCSVILAKNCPVEKPRQLCLDVPRGGEFKIMLEDSTEVWLNSESTLSYPEVFSPTERRVRVSGEAYFAVHKDPTRPFYVETDEQIVRVYGTAFNVRAYPDDSYVYTTLEHGSISITRADISSGEVMLSPGHQALLNRDDKKLNMRTVDPQIITGWRHGRFVFEEQPLSSIMRDLSRWYDFKYEFTSPDVGQIVFMGSIPRYADFTTAIAIIEKSGGLQFTTRGDKVIISRKQ